MTNNFFSWDRLREYIPLLLEKLPVTFEIVFISFILGSLLALLLAVVRIKKIPVLNQIIRVFVSFERGTPMLVQMLVVYYAFPLLIEALLDISTRGWSRMNFVIITFILNEGAFLSETYRASIIAIPRGQREAAYASGLTNSQAFFRIILPQAVRIAIPPAGLNLIGIFQSTSLVYMIGVMDMIGMANAIGARTGHTIESYLFITVIFVAVNQILTRLFKKLDKKLAFASEPPREDI